MQQPITHNNAASMHYMTLDAQDMLRLTLHNSATPINFITQVALDMLLLT
jgi:hypothetical protein